MSEDFYEQVLSYLPADYPWRDSFTYFPEIDSTNNFLKRSCLDAPHGRAACAGHQTGGRGRMGRSFLSLPGVGVYLSMLLRPQCRPEELLHLTCAVAVAMCDAVEAAAGFRPGIKWTNDLVYEKRKLCGILTELGLRADGSVDYAVVGIGINCLQRPEDFPPELRDKAGSLAMVTGSPVSRPRLAAEMLAALYRMDKVLLTDKPALLARYRGDCVTLGREVSVVCADSVRHGRALDIDENGALVVEFTDGHVEAVDSGEVSVRDMYGYL